MVHKMVKMEPIKKEKALQLTYKKRKASLLKKASEFSTLCGVDACIIIFGPTPADDSASNPETWPPNSEEVKRIINRYRNGDHPRRCHSLFDYFVDKKKKVESEIAKLKERNCKAKYPPWNEYLNKLLVEQLREFASKLDSKLQLSDRKLQILRQNQLFADKVDSKFMIQGGFQNIGENIYNMDINNFRPSNLPVRFHPEASSHNYQQLLSFPVEPMMNTSSMIPLNQNLMDDVLINMLSYQNNSNQFGGMMSSMGEFELRQNVQNACVNYPSSSWMNNSLMFYNPNPSVSYLNPTMQPMLPHLQFPSAGMPYQMLPPVAKSELDNSNNGIGEHDQKWR